MRRRSGESDANATRWAPLQLLSLRGQGMAEPGSESPLLSPGAASTLPRDVGCFGERRGDGAALARSKRARGEAPLNAAGVAPLFLHTDGKVGEEAGHVASQQCLLILGLSSSAHTGSPTTLRTWETLPRSPCKHQPAAGLLSAGRMGACAEDGSERL